MAALRNSVFFRRVIAAFCFGVGAIIVMGLWGFDLKFNKY
jgi:hypothetical protein